MLTWDQKLKPLLVRLWGLELKVFQRKLFRAIDMQIILAFLLRLLEALNVSQLKYDICKEQR